MVKGDFYLFRLSKVFIALIIFTFCYTSHAELYCEKALESEILMDNESSYSYEQHVIQQYKALGKPLFTIITPSIALRSKTPEYLLHYTMKLIRRALADSILFANSLNESHWQQFILYKMNFIENTIIDKIVSQELLAKECPFATFNKSNIKDFQVIQCIRNIGHFLYKASGLWQETINYLRFRNVVGFDIKIKDLVDESAQQEALKAGMHSDCLKKNLNCEIDFLLADGTWVEVKNLLNPFDIISDNYDYFLKKARGLVLLAKQQSQLTGKPIQVVFAFFKSGISEAAKADLEETGVIVLDAVK